MRLLWLRTNWLSKENYGKVSDLRDTICSILNVSLTSVNVDSYICNERCYRDLKHLEKIREDAKTLVHLLKEKSTTNRPKRSTDSRISLSVAAPSKSQTSPRKGSNMKKGRKKLVICWERCNQNSHTRSVTIGLAPPSCTFGGNNISDANCEGNICQVQVSAN